MVEGTPLLREHAAYTCIEGSNPSVSAKSIAKPLITSRFQGFFVLTVSRDDLVSITPPASVGSSTGFCSPDTCAPPHPSSSKKSISHTHFRLQIDRLCRIGLQFLT